MSGELHELEKDGTIQEITEDDTRVKELYKEVEEVQLMAMEKPLGGDAQSIILESISDGVFTVDHEWRITSFNRAAEEITGISRDKAIGSFCREVFRSNMCEENCALKRSMEEGKNFVSSSTYITNKKDEQIPITVSTSPLVNEGGEVLGGVETFRDHSLVEELRRELAGTAQLQGMISRAGAMTKILNILPQVAESDSTVLIHGETGTGKELLARAIHSLSGRSAKLFTAINCGALPDSLLESELFGYKSGAFTGAERDKPGILEAAADGTILLDEIGDTSAAFQVKLLRVLEEHEFQPLGAVSKMKTDARVIAATNCDLEKMIDNGEFRRDLYYRINIVRLELPPLRERTEDIPLLIDYFIERMNLKKGCNVSGIEPAAMTILLAHDYPGNIRELENIIEHSFVLCRNGEIAVDHLPSHLLKSSLNVRVDKGGGLSSASIAAAVQSAEGEAILTALIHNNYNRKAAAAELGMHKSTLHRKLKKLQLSLPDFDGRSSRQSQ